MEKDDALIKAKMSLCGSIVKLIRVIILFRQISTADKEDHTIGLELFQFT
jgi:hypothetical protein